MKEEKVFESIGNIDEKYVAEARTVKKKRPVWVAWVAIAACLCLAIFGATRVIPNRNKSGNQVYAKIESIKAKIVTNGSEEKFAKSFDKARNSIEECLKKSVEDGLISDYLMDDNYYFYIEDGLTIVDTVYKPKGTFGGKEEVYHDYDSAYDFGYINHFYPKTMGSNEIETIDREIYIPSDRKARVLIASFVESDESCWKNYKKLMDDNPQADFDVVRSADIDTVPEMVSFWHNLGSYDVLIFEGHGTASNDGSRQMQVAAQMLKKQFQNELRAIYGKTDDSRYDSSFVKASDEEIAKARDILKSAGIEYEDFFSNEAFFNRFLTERVGLLAQYTGSNTVRPYFGAYFLKRLLTPLKDGAIIYTAACSVLNNDDVASCFIGKGAAAVVGYDNTVEAEYTGKMAYSLFDSYLDGNGLMTSMNKAYDDVAPYNKTTDGGKKIYTHMIAMLPQITAIVHNSSGDDYSDIRYSLDITPQGTGERITLIKDASHTGIDNKEIKLNCLGKYHLTATSNGKFFEQDYDILPEDYLKYIENNRSETAPFVFEVYFDGGKAQQADSSSTGNSAGSSGDDFTEDLDYPMHGTVEGPGYKNLMSVSFSVELGYYYSGVASAKDYDEDYAGFYQKIRMSSESKRSLATRILNASFETAVAPYIPETGYFSCTPLEELKEALGEGFYFDTEEGRYWFRIDYESMAKRDDFVSGGTYGKYMLVTLDLPGEICPESEGGVDLLDDDEVKYSYVSIRYDGDIMPVEGNEELIYLTFAFRDSDIDIFPHMLYGDCKPYDWLAPNNQTGIYEPFTMNSEQSAIFHQMRGLMLQIPPRYTDVELQNHSFDFRKNSPFEGDEPEDVLVYIGDGMDIEYDFEQYHIIFTEATMGSSVYTQMLDQNESYHYYSVDIHGIAIKQ